MKDPPTKPVTTTYPKPKFNQIRKMQNTFGPTPSQAKLQQTIRRCRQARDSKGAKEPGRK